MPTDEMPAAENVIPANVIDCEGRLVTPGLVDAHNHLIFGGWRQKEMALKLAGTPYLDILKQGGGILSTVEHTRLASEDELIQKGKTLLKEMLRHGVTVSEAKSGYGLDLQTEMKQLRVIRALNHMQPIELVPTFLGAHAVPKEYAGDRAGYIELLCSQMLPAISAEGLAEFCDVFCESTVFTPEESAKILARAASLGFRLKAHVDEIAPINGAKMAANAGCVSADHLIQTSDEGIRALAGKKAVAVLLPATSFYLGEPYARARRMVDERVPVAIATDFNPGSCPGLNLQFAMNLACIRYRLTPAEALTAVTLNGAAAIGRAGGIGSAEPGKNADLVIWDAYDLEYIFYRFGSNLVWKVVKDGCVYSNS
jgi:imidazolonepropionase